MAHCYFNMKLLPEDHARVLSFVTAEWRTAKQISRLSRVALARVNYALAGEADRGSVLYEYRRLGHRGAQVMVYKNKTS